MPRALKNCAHASKVSFVSQKRDTERAMEKRGQKCETKLNFISSESLSLILSLSLRSPTLLFWLSGCCCATSGALIITATELSLWRGKVMIRARFVVARWVLLSMLLDDERKFALTKVEVGRKLSGVNLKRKEQTFAPFDGVWSVLACKFV